VYEIETVSLRYFNVFGPRQDPNSQYAAVVPRFVRAIADGAPVTIYGDGQQSRDFTYVANVVEANLLAADADGASGAILNVATGGSETVDGLSATIGRLLGREVEKSFEPERAGDVRASWADITLARSTIGFEPRIGLEDGLRLTIESLLEGG
jgi:UDP-glucose 4-epimerase